MPRLPTETPEQGLFVVRLEDQDVVYDGGGPTIDPPRTDAGPPGSF